MDAALFQEPRRRMIPLRDGEMAALDFGDAARPVDVVFSHANGFNAMTYRSILGPLSMGLRILAVDLRGHGSSTLPADATKVRRSWDDTRDDLVQLLDVLDQKPAVLAGHSLGGAVSILAADIRPQRVKSLVLFDPVILSPWRSFQAWLPWNAGRRWREIPIAKGAAKRRPVFDSAEAAFAAYKGRGAFKTWPETVLADYVAGGFTPTEEGKVTLACAPAWEASNFAAQANDIWGALRRLKAPLSLYQAETGSACEIGEGGSDLLRRKPDAKVIVVPGTSHFLPMERPDVVRDALLDAAD